MSTQELPSPEEQSEPVTGPALREAFCRYFDAVACPSGDSLSQITYAAHEIARSEVPYAQAVDDSAIYFSRYLLDPQGSLITRPNAPLTEPEDKGDLILRAPVQALCFSGLLVSKDFKVREAAQAFHKGKAWLNEVITSAQNDLLDDADPLHIRVRWHKAYVSLLSRTALSTYAQ